MQFSQADYERAAARLIHHSFTKEFNRLAQLWKVETDAIRRAMPDAISDHKIYKTVKARAQCIDPYDGLPIPLMPDNNLGTDFNDPNDNKVVRYYDTHMAPIDAAYVRIANSLNARIGQAFALSATQQVLQNLSDLWGERLNLSLPFRTGHEPYQGSQYAEAILRITPSEEFVLHGFAYNRANQFPNV